MITTVEIIRALSGMAEDIFGRPPETKDIREITRPCVYLTPILTAQSRESALRGIEQQFELVYFAERTEQGYRALLTAEAALMDALEQPIEVCEEFHIVPEDLDYDFNREDMALTAEFTVRYYQGATELPEPGSDELMEELDKEITTKE